MVLIAYLLIAALLAVFLVQNAASTELHFLVWSVAMPQALLVFLVLLIGVLLGWSLHAYVAFRRRRKAVAAGGPAPPDPG